ncbi:MAG TPA: hypothetical protein VGR41_01020 [Actinomycetota bacterium]|jgi:hypothetical protein|nr:hypothetical protein [Actinomycetota bacterium]
MLRLVLEGEGFDVVAEAATRADLVRAAGAEQPDVVVLDEAIGSGAIAMTRAVSPSAKVIVVSPEEPAGLDVDGWVALPQVIRGFGIAVLRACAPPGGPGQESATESFVGPAWVDRVKKDAATLREILSAGSKRGGEERPSVTALRWPTAGFRLHPSMMPRREEPAAEPDTTPPARLHAHPHKR